MARKETVIPEKIIKSKVNVEVTCDCCGGVVDGYWHMSSNQNGCLFSTRHQLTYVINTSIILTTQFLKNLIRLSILIHDTVNLAVKRIRNTF